MVATFLLSALAGAGAWFALRAVLGEVGKDVVFLSLSVGFLIGNSVRRHWWIAVPMLLSAVFWTAVLLGDLRERELRGQR